MKVINRKSFFLSKIRKIAPPPIYTKLNSRAFSLIEVMVAMSILTILSYFMADMIVNQQQAISTSEARMENLEIFRQIQGFLVDSKACKETFAGDSSATPPREAIKLDVDSGGGFSTSTVNAIRDQNGAVVFEENGTYGNGSVVITGVVIKNETVPQEGGTGNAALILSTKRKKGTLKEHTITRTLRLQVVADPSEIDAAGKRKITACFSTIDTMLETIAVNSLEQALALNGCSFDRETESISCDAPGLECSVENSSCQENYVLIQTLPSGKKVCCKNLRLSVEETCDMVGGVYKESTCAPGDSLVKPGGASYLMSGATIGQTITWCDFYGSPYSFRTPSCRNGFVATELTLTEVLNRSVTISGRRAVNSNKAYAASACINTPFPTGTTPGISKMQFSMTCREQTDCYERCSYSIGSALMKDVSISVCDALGGVYDHVLGQCRSRNNDGLTLKCATQDTPCSEDDVQVVEKERWRVCLKGYTDHSDMEACESDAVSALDAVSKLENVGILARLGYVWRCTENDSNYCHAPAVSSPGDASKLWYSCAPYSSASNNLHNPDFLSMPSYCSNPTLQTGIAASSGNVNSCYKTLFQGKNLLNPVTGKRDGKRYFCSSDHDDARIKFYMTHDLLKPTGKYRCCN